MIKRYRAFLGVDPGTAGGLALLRRPISYQFVDALPPAVFPFKGKEPCQIASWLFAYVMPYCTDGDIDCCIEQVSGWQGGNKNAEGEDYKHGGAPGSTMFTFGEAYGLIQGMLMMLDVPARKVTPQKWQKHLGIPGRDRKGGETYSQFKSRLKEEAVKRYPDLTVTLGVSDALLIADYCFDTSEGK